MQKLNIPFKAIILTALMCSFTQYSQADTSCSGYLGTKASSGGFGFMNLVRAGLEGIANARDQAVIRSLKFPTDDTQIKNSFDKLILQFSANEEQSPKAFILPPPLASETEAGKGNVYVPGYNFFEVGSYSENGLFDSTLSAIYAGMTGAGNLPYANEENQSWSFTPPVFDYPVTILGTPKPGDIVVKVEGGKLIPYIVVSSETKSLGSDQTGDWGALGNLRTKIAVMHLFQATDRIKELFPEGSDDRTKVEERLKLLGKIGIEQGDFFLQSLRASQDK